MGVHEYYCMATMVSADFAEIAYRVKGKQNGMNHNNKSLPIEREGEIESKPLKAKYGKSKQLRWIKGRVILPIGYVQYEYPRYKRREVNKYLRKESDWANMVSFEVMKHFVEDRENYPTLEMADNALSRYIAQRGKCAVTHNPLALNNMRCIHIKPVDGVRNDTYANLIILEKGIANLVMTDSERRIEAILKRYKLKKDARDKINTLRAHRGLEPIQFKTTQA